MNKQETKGKRQQVEGQARDTMGKMTGDKSEQIKGKAKKAEGTIREGVGKAGRKVKRR